jgi:hypothetical protein
MKTKEITIKIEVKDFHDIKWALLEVAEKLNRGENRIEFTRLSAKMIATMDYKNHEEPRIEKINGKQCLVFESNF